MKYVNLFLIVLYSIVQADTFSHKTNMLHSMDKKTTDVADIINASTSLLWDNTDINWSGYYEKCVELLHFPENEQLYHGADDFLVPDDVTWDITRLLVQKYGNPEKPVKADSVGLIIYSDDNNKPGSIVYRTSFPEKFYAGFKSNRYFLKIPIKLESNRYWLTVFGIYTTSPDKGDVGWGWALGSQGINNKFMSEDLTGTHGGHSWSTHDGIESSSAYFAFYGDIIPNQGAFWPDFQVDKSSGPPPLEVQFKNTTIYHDDSSTLSFEWDFDGDGVVDSRDQDPVWTYTTPDIYDVRLTVSSNEYVKEQTKPQAISVIAGEGALYFDGSNGLSNSKLGRAITPSMHLTEKMTTEFWVHPDAWGPITYEGEYQGQAQILRTPVWEITLYESIEYYGIKETASFSFMDFNQNTGELNYLQEVILPDYSIFPGEWQHIAVSFDIASKELIIYLNGEKQEYKSFGTFPTNLNPHLGWFFEISSSIRAFEGYIDEVRLWNSVRSEEDIKAFMNQKLTGTENGLVAYWAFDELQGRVAIDKTKNKNNLGITNPQWRQGIFEEHVKVEQSEPTRPFDVSLYQNYPNPFNPSTTIEFENKSHDKVVLEIYDIMGRKVKTLINENRTPGRYAVTWNSDNDFGKSVSAGIYIARLAMGEYQKSIKLSLIK
jgi:PKD repeat protein